MGSRDRRRHRRLEAQSDRIEDRLVDAPIGLHQLGGPGDRAALEAAGLSEEAVELWRRWDGLDLANGEVRLLPFAEHEHASAEAAQAGVLREGDRVIGELGLGLLVIPADPWEEGAEVVLVEDDGERAPYASDVLRLVLSLVAEMAVTYDEDGEYREGLFDDRGQLLPDAERRLLRRRLDFDEDAALPRFRLAQLLRRNEELRAARSELEHVIRCAPQFAWAHWELGRVELELQLGEQEGARPGRAMRSFGEAAEAARNPMVRALFLAWQARAAEDEQREAIAGEVLKLDPSFVSAREAGLREAIEHEDGPRARELLALGLAIAPRQLGLLGLREAVEALPLEPPDDGALADEGYDGVDEPT